MGEPPQPHGATGDGADSRLEALCAWLADVLPAPMAGIAPASADASFRRYFRVRLGDPVARSRAKRARHARLSRWMRRPPREDCRPYVETAKLLAAAGVHAPAVARHGPPARLPAADRPGHAHVSGRARAPRPRPALYADASAALVRWQFASRDGCLPLYDEMLLRRELDLFPDWYVARHLGVASDRGAESMLERAFRVAPGQQSRASAVCSCIATIIRGT